MPSDLFDEWLEAQPVSPGGTALHSERHGARPAALAKIRPLVVEHFVGAAIVVQAGGFERAAEIIRHSLPTNKRTQAGDLAELLASEFIEATTPFRVPVKKLRWKSDRQMPMHGNDVIAVDVSSPSGPLILKGECKSRRAFNTAAASDATTTLDRHEGRPNPSTIGFIIKRLYEAGRDTEAMVFQALQVDTTLPVVRLRHWIFALSGNDPTPFLDAAASPALTGLARSKSAIVVSSYAEFIAAVYDLDGQTP